jgi:hypothetical protein
MKNLLRRVAITPSPQPSPPAGARELLLPLPLAGEGWEGERAPMKHRSR